MIAFLKVGIVFLELVKHLEKCTRPKEVLFDAFMKRIVEKLENLDHRLHVKDVIPEYVSIGREVEVSTVNNVPKGNIS